LAEIKPSDIAYDHIPGKTRSPEAEKPKDRSLIFDLYVKFKETEREDPIHIATIDTPDDLTDALEKLLKWPLVVSLREIIIDVEEVEP